jgi:hypothetical protein
MEMNRQAHLLPGTALARSGGGIAGHCFSPA